MQVTVDKHLNVQRVQHESTPELDWREASRRYLAALEQEQQANAEKIRRLTSALVDAEAAHAAQQARIDALVGLLKGQPAPTPAAQPAPAPMPAAPPAPAPPPAPPTPSATRLAQARRLTDAIAALMADGRPHTVREITQALRGSPEAQHVRDLSKRVADTLYDHSRRGGYKRVAIGVYRVATR